MTSLPGLMAEKVIVPVTLTISTTSLIMRVFAFQSSTQGVADLLSRMCHAVDS